MPVGTSGPARSTTHCVDAGIVVRAVVTGDPVVRRLWRDFRSTGADLVAPLLLRYEVTNAIHRLGRAAEWEPSAVTRLLTMALDLPIDCYDELDLHARAAELASSFALPAAYDAHYLALAQRLGVDFWTTDRKLVKVVGDRLPWVRLVE